ncbi:MAG TPA: RNA methyltransferase [Polyangia bacterium]|jgi:TrmH family RNA methyltransferase
MTTISQAELKQVRALQQKKYRGETRRFLVQGRKVVAELLASALRTDAIYASAEAAKWIGPAAAHRLVPVYVLAPHELDKVGTFETGNELVAVAIQPEEPAFRAPGPGELMLALDGVHDPRNMGGLLRIADWFGLSRVLCSPECMEIYNPKVVQSTMGSIFRVPVRYAPLADELSRCAAAGARVYLASMDGAPVFATTLSHPAVLVLGSESHGLSETLRALNAPIISIPRYGQAESLNVAMAAAALCTEFARQAHQT